MWTPPAELRTQTQAGEELSPSVVSAEETLSSCTGEVLTSRSLGARGGRQPGPQTSESGREGASWGPADERAALCHFLARARKQSERWLANLRGKGADYERCRSASDLSSETPRLSEEERKALQSFCTLKVDLLRHRVDTKAKRSSRPRKPQLRWDVETAEGDDLHCIVPDELLSRIYVKNTRAALKQMSEAKFHTTSQCPDCNSKRAELAQYDFLKRKTTLLQSLLLQEKIDDHLYTTDFLARVGEALQGLPRLSDDPRLIWKRLNEKTQVGDSGFEWADAKQKM